MSQTESIKQFLITSSQQGYGSADTVVKKEENESHTISFTKNDFRLDDNYFGGEPFGGREVIFYKDKPIWIMVYYGAVLVHDFDVNKIYGFLKECLLQPDKDLPVRGPKSYMNEDLEYEFSYGGTLDSFKGTERIKYKGKNVFFGDFIGGLVDKDK